MSSARDLIRALKPKSEGQRLIDECTSHIPTFLSEETGQAFASFPDGEGHQILPIRSAHVRDIVVNFWMNREHNAPREDSLRFALRTMESRALRKLEARHLVFHRIAAYGDSFGNTVQNLPRIVIDLKNQAAEVIMIDHDGWDVMATRSHCFTRGAHMKPLPNPARAGDRASTLATFRRLLNPAGDRDFHRSLIWLLSAMRGTGPFPVLAFQGPPSSGKTAAASILRYVADPAVTPFADSDSNTRDLIAHARSNWVLGFDNLLRLPARLASFANSLASGRSIEVKQGRDPHGVIAEHLQRPVMLTFQSPEAAKSLRSDPGLHRRSLLVNQAELTPERNKPMHRVWGEFQQLLPQLLGLLCTALSTALKNLPKLNPERLPRLSDAAIWAIAAAPALGLTEQDILDALDIDPDSDPDGPPLVNAVQDFMSGRDGWTGTATELLDELPVEAVPATPKGLSQQLRRFAPHLAKLGIHLDFLRNGTKRTIVISRLLSSDASYGQDTSPLVRAAAAARVTTLESVTSARHITSSASTQKVVPMLHPRHTYSAAVRDRMAPVSIDRYKEKSSHERRHAVRRALIHRPGANRLQPAIAAHRPRQRVAPGTQESGFYGPD